VVVSDAGKRDWHSLIGTAITLLTLLVSMAVGWTTLREQSSLLLTRVADHENRIRTIETSRALESKLEELRVQIARLEVELRALRTESSRRDR
jgi:hypothetical protein